MKDYLISIIMPVYNAEKRLEVSIDSILNQEYKNIELILINDGSTDESKNICAFYEKKDSRVVVIHQNNLGVSIARNRGIDEATGEYLTFVDSDDTLDACAYSEVVKDINKNDLDIVIFGMSFDYYKENLYCNSKNMSIEKDILLSNNDIKNYFFDLYEKNYLSSVWNKIIKTSLIKTQNINFESEMAILEDFKFVLDILEHSKNILAKNAIYYYYYNDMTNSSLKNRANIDYLQNFKILDYRLRNFSGKIGLNTIENNSKINGMILRFYIIGLEKIFTSNVSNIKKNDELLTYLKDKDVKRIINNAKCSSTKLKIIHWLMRNKFNKLVFILFYINSSWKK